MNLTCTNIQLKGASFKKNGQLSSYGLRRAVDMIANENLPRAARVILSQVCQVAASTSAYKITMSRKRMAELCGTQEATIRRNLKKAVEANILTETLVFDKSEKGRGQLPTEYQFTQQFMEAAVSLCKILDSAAKVAIAKARTVFAKTLHGIRSFFSGPDTPRSKISAAPDQSDRQLLVSFEDKNSKDIPAKAEKISLVQKVKSWAEAKHERATTKAADYAARQENERAERESQRLQLDKLVSKRAFVTGNVTRKPLASQSTQTTSFNAARFEEANREHDRRMQEAAAAAAAARERGPRQSLLEKHFPHRKKTMPEQDQI